MLVGVVKIYSKKAKYLLNDCSDALSKIKVRVVATLLPAAIRVSHSFGTRPVRMLAIGGDPELCNRPYWGHPLLMLILRSVRFVAGRLPARRR